MAKYIMLAVPTPPSHADKVRDAIGNAGGGHMGNYKFGSFTINGVGRGIALEGATPAEGEIGKLEEVEEERIEVFCKPEEVERIVDAIKAVHPYEGVIITATEVEIY